jgi:hypothetical protein
MIEVKFHCKYKGIIFNKFESEAALDQWVEENIVEYDIMYAYKKVNGAWVQI